MRGLRLFMLGADRSSWTVGRRERLAQPAAAFHSSFVQLRDPSVVEAMVVSTCHRVEFYLVATSTESVERIVRHLVGAQDDGWTRASDLAAAVHLARVASGLMSAVLGEHEIAGQIRRSAFDAGQSGASGPLMRHIVAGALAASGRVRSETSLGRGARSIGGAAVQRLEEAGDLVGARLLILGAGGVAQDIGRRLSSRRSSLQYLAIASRSVEHATRLASLVKADAVHPWHDALARLPHFDVVVAAVHSAGSIITADWVRGDGSGSLRERLILDLSMPRAFDRAAREVPGVRMINIDEIESTAAEALRLREDAVPPAEAIVAHEAGLGFERFLQRARQIACIRVA